MKKAPQQDTSSLRPVSRIEDQAGVIAWLPNVVPIRFALVTSRRTGRWVFPKGGIEDGMTGPESAAQEALEEAGLIGRPDPTPVGSFMTPKIRPPLIWTVRVLIYPMRVDGVLDVWDEADRRLRRFVTLDEARRLIEEPQMLEIAETFVRQNAPA